MPTWVGPTVALSLVVIAAAFASVALATWWLGRRTAEGARALAREMAALRQELEPTIGALRRLAETGDQIGREVREEARAVLETSRRVRQEVERGVRRVRHRLTDLDALYEVVHDEVQDTALDVAATLRTVRTGAGALARIKRLLVRGRR
jgi:biopolymer transport protein ExbB/TolQ